MVSGVTWVFEGCCGHQLEFIKIVRQTTRKPYPDIVRSIVQEKGIVGLWDGFVPWGTVQALAKGAVFGFANAFIRQALRPAVDAGFVSTSASDTLAGAGAGGVQGFVLSPTLLLKTRVMTDDVFRQRMGVVETTQKSFAVGYRVIRTEGHGDGRLLVGKFDPQHLRLDESCRKHLHCADQAVYSESEQHEEEQDGKEVGPGEHRHGCGIGDERQARARYLELVDGDTLFV